MSVATTAKIHPNVRLGAGVEVGDFVVIGEPPRGKRPGELETVIGAGAVIRSHTVIYAGNVLGEGFQTGHGVLIREQNQIGRQVSIGSGSIIEHHVVIEDGVRVHSHAFVPEFSILRKGCWLGPRVVLTNARYPISKGVKDSLKGPIVGAGAIIGANSTLLPGVKIGARALVGAGSVVTRDVPAATVVMGNPASGSKSVADLGVYDAPAEG